MTRFIAGLALVLSLLGAACSSGPPSKPRTSPSTSAPIAVEGTWASAAGSHAALVYFGLSNRGAGPDVLLGATSEIGGRAIVRQTTSTGAMAPVQHLIVPGGGHVAFEPGSYAVELVGVDPTLRSGSVVRLGLRFERAGLVEVSAGVR